MLLSNDCLAGYTYHHAQNVARNMNVKVLLVRSQREKGGNVIGHWREGSLCYKMAENMVELCSVLGRKVELVSNDLGCFTWVFLSSVEGAAWLLFAA